MSRLFGVAAVSLLVAGPLNVPAWSQEPPKLHLRVGEKQVMCMTKNQPIAKAHNADPKICHLQAVNNDPTGVLITALAPGVSQLRFDDKDKRHEVINVVVSDSQPTKPLESLRPGETEISLLDGSVIRVATLFEKIDIVTSYGQLSIPCRDIRAIEFGRHMPDGADKEIQKAIRALGSTDVREREQAGKSLLALGPFSYAAVCEAAVMDDLEVSRRATHIAKELETKHAKEDLRVGVKDRVVTAEFTIVGTIMTRQFKARSPWLGELNLSVAGLRSLRACAEQTARSTE